MQRFLDLAPIAGLGYFAGIGALKLTHDFAGFPSSFDWAAVLALVPAAFAVLARIQRDRGAGEGEA